jgi:hypothetical protein
MNTNAERWITAAWAQAQAANTWEAWNDLDDKLTFLEQCLPDSEQFGEIWCLSGVAIGHMMLCNAPLFSKGNGVKP